jgi:replicative DNA helicase
MQIEFDNNSVEDIINVFDQNVLELKDIYCSNSTSTGCQAAQGMAALKEQYKQIPEMGMPLSSAKLTTILRGRRLKKLYLKTSPSGIGKTRLSVGDACCVSIPTIYDSQQKSWISTNCQEPGLIITTELEADEIQTMIMAYVSDVAEDKILDGKYEGDEEERIDKAIEIIGNSPLYIEYIPNFNIDDIERIIKKYKVKHNIGYVFFDYVFTSIKILTEVATKTKGVKLRVDNVLIMFVDRMKTLANVLNVHIDTSSQANGDWKTIKDADQNLIRGAKGKADKVDAGYVILSPTEKDKESIKSITHKGFFKEPNLVYHIYKVRRGKINRVKLWIYFDYATCRTYDLFVTDNDYKLGS